MKDIQEKVIEEINAFTDRNLFNRYASEDFKEFIKELEQKYSCEIDKLSYKVTLKSEIKIGEYIRTINGKIGKVIKKDCGTYRTKNFGASIGEILKHSYDLLDLLEIGDYVNGIQIYSIKQEINPITKQKCVKINEFYTNAKSYYGFYDTDIDKIWTKEELSRIGYKI